MNKNHETVRFCCFNSNLHSYEKILRNKDEKLVNAQEMKYHIDFVQISVYLTALGLFKFVKDVKGNNENLVNQELLELFKFSILMENPFPKHLLNSNETKIKKEEEDIFKQSTSACFGIGRLGNQMCNFASQFALYKEFGIKGYLSSFGYSIMNQIFQMKPQNRYDTKDSFKVINVNELDRNKLSWVYIYPDHLIYNRTILNRFKLSWFIKLRPETCDFKGFLPYIEELKQSYFRFKPKIFRETRKAQNELFKANANNNTIVSIHLRFTDMKQHLKKVFNLRLPTKNYFEAAMVHMKRKIGGELLFLAFSDDRDSAERLLANLNPKLNIKFLDSMLSEGETLAIMSLAKGSILSHSTFGLWGALLRDKLDNIILPKEFLQTDIGYYFSSAKFSNIIYL